MLPFEILILATPVSRRTRRHLKATDWRDQIREAAAKDWGNKPPLNQEVVLRVAYFYRGSSLDLDNVLVPIQNGLEGVVFSNDSLVTDVIMSKRPLEGSFRVGMSPLLASGFESGADFLHITIDVARDLEVLR